MFWGLVLHPGTIHSETVKTFIQITRASLDLSSEPDAAQDVVLWVYNRNKEYIVCYLSAYTKQLSLDLHFQAGEKFSLFCLGPASVHLIGYTLDKVMEEEEEHEDVDEEKVAKKRAQPEKSKEGKALKKGKVSIPVVEDDEKEEPKQPSPKKPSKVQKKKEKELPEPSKAAPQQPQMSAPPAVGKIQLKKKANGF
ncbi:46 kDa FK506-binding nuclear protein-like [Daphnia pulex]|uniref:46 kDa FK506-binding nuclear protein-like n=1 Tax=Daphnia pulex TaxID=6669 RepID=UPI001EE0D4D7|nr:46 kDa FK506-binding nuclear protein-like [Daphnia pulex]